MKPSCCIYYDLYLFKIHTQLHIKNYALQASNKRLKAEATRVVNKATHIQKQRNLCNKIKMQTRIMQSKK